MTEAKRLLDRAIPLPWSHDGADIRDVGLVDEPEDAALIVYAVNHLPAYEAAVEALERLTNIQDPAEYSPAWDAGRAALRRLREDPA